MSDRPVHDAGRQAQETQRLTTDRLRAQRAETDRIARVHRDQLTAHYAAQRAQAGSSG